MNSSYSSRVNPGSDAVVPVSCAISSRSRESVFFSISMISASLALKSSSSCVSVVKLKYSVSFASPLPSIYLNSNSLLASSRLHFFTVNKVGVYFIKYSYLSCVVCSYGLKLYSASIVSSSALSAASVRES